MVLHNDKWKYKQKRDYMRKHGLLKKKPNPNEQLVDDDSFGSDNQQEETIQQTENNSTGIEDHEHDSNGKDDDDDSDGEGSGEPTKATAITPIRRKKKLQNNNWRFKDDLLDDDGIIKDPEILEQIRLKKEEELRVQRENANVVLQKLEILGEDNIENFKKSNKVKTAIEMSNEDLLSWSLNDDKKITHRDHEIFQPKNKNVRVLTEEERKKYFEMQKEVNHMKMIDSMKHKFNPNDKLKVKGKVLQLDLETDRDKYQDVLKKSFRNNVDKGNVNDDNSLEQNVNQVLGINLSDEKDNDVDNLAFDMNKLMNVKGTTVTKKISKPRKPTGKISKAPATAALDDEDFLDELLG